MSAITGIYHRDGHFHDKNNIKNMNDCLSHRGPDDSGILCKESIAFGHQMLHTTPESINEKLPYMDEINGLFITSDARIDNRLELSEILNLENAENVPDSLFILKAYEKWGEKCPEKLLGDFAFAIWDKKEEKLFCARDHMGVKPFYYYLSDDIFLFATEKKSILINPDISKELNELRIGFFLKNFLDKESTFYKNISILPPAHSLTIKAHKISKVKYWELNPDFQIKLGSDEEYFKKFREIFTESLKCRLRSVSSVGFDLSGGLDSSSIVCMSKKILKDEYGDLNKLNTFSYAFDELNDCDEREYIQKVIDQGRVKPHFIMNDHVSPLDLLETALECEDQPFKNPFLSMRMNLYKKVNDIGLNIILSGAGGDIIVSHGQRYILELAIKGKWKKLIKETRHLSKRKNRSFFYELGENIIFPFIPNFIKKLKCLFSKKTACETKNYINIEFETYLNLNYKINEIESPDKKFKNINSAKYYHYYLIHMSPNQNFLQEIDPISASYYIEPRYPYYDKRLIEFCYAIPTEMKFRLGWDRFILRNAMENILPPEVQWRPSKVNFTSFLRKNLILFEKNNLNTIFLDSNDIINNYVELNIIKNIYIKYKNNVEIHYMDIYKLWIVAVLFTWLKKNNRNNNRVD